MKKSLLRRILSLFLYLLFNVCIVCAGLFAYIKWAEYTEHDVIPLLSKQKIIKSIFLKNEFIELSQIIMKDEENGFSAPYDFDAVIALSKNMFVNQEMFGAKKYMHRPNIGIYNVVVWSGLQGVEFAMAATPEIKKAIAQNELFHNVYFKTDTCGFKKTEFTWHPDSYTIFFLGDSFTEGLWVTPEETFVNQTGVKLREENISVTPINLGVDGYSVLEMDWMLEHYTSTFHPKIVVANLFPNDVHDDYFEVIQGNSIPEKNYEEMFYYLQRMKDFCERLSIKFVISDIPVKEQFKELRGFYTFQNRVKTWCDTKGILYIDPYRYFDMVGVDSLYFSWDPHFSPRGHAVYAEFLYQQLDSLIISEKVSVE